MSVDWQPMNQTERIMFSLALAALFAILWSNTQDDKTKPTSTAHTTIMGVWLPLLVHHALCARVRFTSCGRPV